MLFDDFSMEDPLKKTFATSTNGTGTYLLVVILICSFILWEMFG